MIPLAPVIAPKRRPFIAKLNIKWPPRSAIDAKVTDATSLIEWPVVWETFRKSLPKVSVFGNRQVATPTPQRHATEETGKTRQQPERRAMHLIFSPTPLTEGENGKCSEKIYASSRSLVYVDGNDVRTLPLVRRKTLLKKIVRNLPNVIYVDQADEHTIVAIC